MLAPLADDQSAVDTYDIQNGKPPASVLEADLLRGIHIFFGPPDMPRREQMLVEASKFFAETASMLQAIADLLATSS